MHDAHIAVVGAGIAGLACAREIAHSDVAVTVFERAQGLGGRVSTRRVHAYSFDHGGQYVTARGTAFVRYVEAAQRSGTIAPWKPRVREDGRMREAPVEDWFVGVPGMSTIVRPLTPDVDVQTGIGVQELLMSARGWELQTDSGRESRVYDGVAVAVPAPEALGLLGGHGGAFNELAKVRFSPCWALMLTFDSPVDLGADVLRWTSGPLRWAACNSTKPRRQERPEAWVVHAAPDWSQARLEQDADDVAGQLFSEFAAAAGVALPRPSHLMAHRWRHAHVEQPLGRAFALDPEIAAGACGDWCIGPRAEAAFESGRALARALLSAMGLAAVPVGR